MSPFRIFVEAGVFGWVLLFLGSIGLVAGLGAGAMLAARQRAAFTLGVLAMLLGSLIAGVALAGNWYARRTVDEAVASPYVVPSQAERIQRAGYEEARSVSVLGLGFALVPLLGGAIAAFGGARRPKDPPLGGVYAPPEARVESEGGGRMLTAALLLAVGAIAYLGAVLPLFIPLPGRDWAFNDPRWSVLDATERVMDGKNFDFECKNLEAALDRLAERRLLPPSPTEAPDLQLAAGKCVDDRIRKIETYPKMSSRRNGLDELAKSSLVLEENSRRKVREAADRVGTDELAGSGDGDAKKQGEAGAPSGRLSSAVIQRVLRGNARQTRDCYQKGLARNPALSGKLLIQFVINQDGTVTEAVSQDAQFADAEVVACVLQVVKRLVFPKPEGGVVSVRYPLVFSADP